MNITILCVGKLKERYWEEAAAEYSKRLDKYCRLQISEIKESRLPENSSPLEEEAARNEEGGNILKRIKKDDHVIALEINGDETDSAGLAKKIENLSVSGKSKLTLIIGGSTGLSAEVLKRADNRISFSKMTFPHQMMRVILLEQLYRSFKIIKNEKYHK